MSCRHRSLQKFGHNSDMFSFPPLARQLLQKQNTHEGSAHNDGKQRKVYKMILSLSCLVTLSYSLSHSFSCAGFYKFVVRDDVISPAGVRNFGTYDDVFEHVHSVARVRKNWATVVAYKSGCANGPEAP